MNFWVLSPNAQNDGKAPYWLKRTKDEGKVFIGYGEDKKHGNTFANSIVEGDCIIVAHGSGDKRKLYYGGLVISDRQYDDDDEIFFRKFDLLVDENDFAANKIVIDSNNAWGVSSNPGTIYQLKETTPADKVVMDKLTQLFNIKIMAKSVQQKIDILRFKKQIILQGPPGTGKTRLAKIIAEELIKPVTITEQDIDFWIKPGLVIDSIQKVTKYTIDTVAADTIKAQSNIANSPILANKLNVVKAYEKKLWKEVLSDGNTSYLAAISNYIYENIGQEQYKLIQFHPAYSYEDFVRGISAKVKGNNVEYKTENRTIGKFAELALNNFIDSRKDVQQINKEKWIESKLEEFAESIETSLGSNPKFPLKNNIYITGVDEDAFRYKGDNWSSESRILFSDFIKMASANIAERKEIKHLQNISKHVFHRKTYYFSLLEKFKEFAKEPEDVAIEKGKVEEKIFVLIIDEINRANLPAVLGELIYALEYRNEKVASLYELENGSNDLILPPNLLIIGTMNTADRSVGHIDYAIRRRFAFVDVLPKEIPELTDNGKKLFQKVALLFCDKFEEGNSDLKNSKYLAQDFKPTDVILGHSYFLVKEEDRKTLGKPDDEILEMKLTYEILPLLREYVKDGILSKEAELQFKPTIAEWLKP